MACQDRTRQDAESERHMDVTSESWQAIPPPQRPRHENEATKSPAR
jgi:hypothetical protein